MDEDELAISGPSAWSRKCLCGKRFHQLNSYSNHINSCKAYKRSVGATLVQAKARYHARKSKKGKSTQLNDGDDLDIDYYPTTSASGSHTAEGPTTTSTQVGGHDKIPDPAADIPDQGTVVGPQETPDDERDGQMEVEPDPVMLGRGHRSHRPTQRYKDFTATSTIPFDIPSTLPMEVETGAPLPTDGPGIEKEVSPSEVLRRTAADERSWKTTPLNRFGLYKKYWTLETRPHDPDSYVSNKDLREEEDGNQEFGDSSNVDDFSPFPNWSSFRLGEWYWADSQEKGRDSFKKLLDIITSEEFDKQEVQTANWDKINESLAASEFDGGPHAFDWADDGTSWRTTAVQIEVPFNSASLQPGLHRYEVQNFRYRPLIPIIEERLKDISRGDYFHIVPTEMRWRPGRDQGGHDVRVYGEMYHSPAFLQAYKEVQSLPPEPKESSLPRYVVGLMFASDETMLASFGTSKLWPLYLMFGNESKYRRGMPSLKLFEEVAYLQSLPDEFQDWYFRASGNSNIGSPLSTYLNRELFHAQWNILLDDDFLQAYRYGIVVDCFDNVRRRFYPRILTYSVDYPEKVRVAGVRSLGDRPCPKCLVPLSDIPNLGTAADMKMRRTQRRKDDEAQKKKIGQARDIIRKERLAVNTAKVEKLLKPISLVPAINAFSDRLSTYGLDVYSLLATDVLHEVEIGSWKSLFIQLLRLLEVVGKDSVNTLNERFRQTPTFGRDTIRRFSSNCAIAAFEGLLPDEHGQRVLDLLFIFAHWHALAKLRIHTDDTLDMLDEWTAMLGDKSRSFLNDTCSVFETLELTREYQSRKRNEARKKAKAAKSIDAHDGASKAGGIRSSRKGKTRIPAASNNPSVTAVTAGTTESPGLTPAADRQGGILPTPEPLSGRGPISALPRASNEQAGLEEGQWLAPCYKAAVREGAETKLDSRRMKTWSLKTPKFHALGDVSDYIRQFGTTDSYSTQLSERFHRFPKARYRRTNKKQTPYQLARIQTRQARLKKLRKQLSPSLEEGPTEDSRDEASYFMGKSQNQPISLTHFLKVNGNDPATTGFLSKLKDHLLPRIVVRLLQEANQSPEDYRLALPALEDVHKTGSFSSAHLNNIYIQSDRLYRHSIIQINFTTYDCRRGQDTLNPSTSRHNIMCFRAGDLDAPDSTLNRSVPGRFIYGRILGIFHLNIIYGGPGMLDHRPRRYDILWVRWYESLDQQFTESTLWSSRRLERVRLKPLSLTGACDFIDPSDVLRAAHIIPRFSQGMKHKDSADRMTSKCAKNNDDWEEYYVNPFVDRDMVMRYHWGMAIGHAYAHTASAQAGDNPCVVGSSSIGHEMLWEQSVETPERLGNLAGESDTPATGMDVDSLPGDAGQQWYDRDRDSSESATDSEDSGYDRLNAGGVDLDGVPLSDEADGSDIQEPESSDEEY